MKIKSGIIAALLLGSSISAAGAELGEWEASSFSQVTTYHVRIDNKASHGLFLGCGDPSGGGATFMFVTKDNVRYGTFSAQMDLLIKGKVYSDVGNLTTAPKLTAVIEAVRSTNIISVIAGGQRYDISVTNGKIIPSSSSKENLCTPTVPL